MGTYTNGKKSSVSPISSFVPYIPFIFGSENRSVKDFNSFLSFPCLVWATVSKNFGGIPNLSTPSMYALITLR